MLSRDPILNLRNLIQLFLVVVKNIVEIQKIVNLQKRGYLTQVFLGCMRKVSHVRSVGSSNSPVFRFVPLDSFWFPLVTIYFILRKYFFRFSLFKFWF